MSGFFEDGNGKLSITRVCFFLLIINGLLMAWYILLTNIDTAVVTNAAMIIGTIVTASGALKVLQKQQEKKEK